jgi:predicted RNA binding protein YcfA (HicA-like mRNA interferase family)
MQVDKVLEKLGFTLVRRGAHDNYTRPGHDRVVSVPRDRNELAPGTLASIWRQAGITAAEAKKVIDQ